MKPRVGTAPDLSSEHGSFSPTWAAASRGASESRWRREIMQRPKTELGGGLGLQFSACGARGGQWAGNPCDLCPGVGSPQGDTPAVVGTIVDERKGFLGIRNLVTVEYELGSERYQA